MSGPSSTSKVSGLTFPEGVHCPSKRLLEEAEKVWGTMSLDAVKDAYMCITPPEVRYTGVTDVLLQAASHYLDSSMPPRAGYGLPHISDVLRSLPGYDRTYRTTRFHYLDLWNGSSLEDLPLLAVHRNRTIRNAAKALLAAGWSGSQEYPGCQP